MKSGKRSVLAGILCLLTLMGCARTGPEPVSAPPTQPDQPQVTEAATAATSPAIHAHVEAVALYEPPAPAAPVIPAAEPSGDARESCPQADIDYSHTDEGYVMVRYTAQTASRLKVLVKGPTTTYSYNLPVKEWTVFPLSDSSGSYQVGIYENIYDSKYALVLSVCFEVALRDEFAPFLRPNQYVNYDAATEAVALAQRLTAGLEDPLDKVACVYDYVVSTLSYDYDKAATVKSGYLPDLDQVLQEQKGICFDYAALMTAMLRSQEIPCKLVVGYAGQTYHAWISVWTEAHGWIDGVIFFDGQVWKRMDPTFASSGERSREIMEFIEHGSYTVKYLY